MDLKLSDDCSILVEKDFNTGAIVWILDAPEPDSPWPVTRPLPLLAGLVLDAHFAPETLAFWILERCISKAVAKEWAGRFAVERIAGEQSLIWSIPVRGVRAWVEAHRQGELWPESCESES